MIGFIGGGNMAEAMIKGMAARGIKDILVSEPRQERRQHLEQLYNLKTTSNNVELTNGCNVVVIAIKPQNLSAIADELKDVDFTNKTVISIMAGINLSTLEKVFRTKNIVRVMPNTPALEQEGMSVMSARDTVSDNTINRAKDILSSIGKILTLPETLMDAVTALSGSGPAFIAHFVDSMIEAGEKLGLARDIATILAIQTMTGTAKLLSTGITPQELIKMVASPGGTTEAGLNILNNRDTKDIVTQTLTAAHQRSIELGKKLSG